MDKSLHPLRPHGFEQIKSAAQIGFKYGLRRKNAAVHVRLSREMHHRVRLHLVEDAAEFVGIANVGLEEAIAGISGDRGQIFEVTCIGELIDVGDLDGMILEGKANEAGADKARAAGDDDSHELLILDRLRHGRGSVAASAPSRSRLGWSRLGWSRLGWSRLI